MKVLFLTDFFLSGQTTHVLELVKQLQELGIKTHIAFGQIHSKLFWSSYIPYLKQNNISFSQHSDELQLLQLIRNWRPDLIHAQSSTLFQRANILSDRFLIPFVVTLHGLGFSQARFKPALTSASAIIAIGPRVADEIPEHKDKVVIIANGIDTQRFCPPKSAKIRKDILYVGRLERKRIEPLKHLVEVHTKIKNSPLQIISNWNPNLPDTSYRPWQTNLAPALQKSGIVVACGRTAREALSAGNAVLLMQQSYDGIISPQLVQYPDFDFSGNLGRFPLADLEDDLRMLLKRSHQRKKLQQWGRNYALVHLSSREMARKTAEVYDEVV